MVVHTMDPAKKAKAVYVGKSTSDGAADGSTIVCAPLAGRPNYDGLTVVVVSGANRGQSREIVGDTRGTARDSTKVWAYDGGAYTDETNPAKEDTPNDMTLLPALPEENDAYYFAYSAAFYAIDLYVSTAGAGTWTLVWEYYNGTSWTTLPLIDDQTNGFKRSGRRTISWSMPTDWAQVAVNGTTAYWVRARVSSFTAITTQPLGQRAWLFDAGSIMVNIAFEEQVLSDVAIKIQGDVVSFAEIDGLAFRGRVTTGGSTTANKIAGLAGFGDDYFNTHFWMQVIKTTDGLAPIHEVRQITDYSSADGTFTTAAFTDTLTAGDEVLILHEVLVAIGRDDNNNAFASTNVTQNEDGSMLERLEYIQKNLIPDISGLCFQGMCDAGMASSKTTIVSADLAGYGDDFFNDKYFMQIIKNADVPGTAPELEVQLISDYVSATGTFTTNAFTADVEEADEILILHEVLVAIGRDDADNAFDSSTVVQNEDGSMLERLEYIQKNLIADISGLCFQGMCDAGMASSKTTIVSADLAGYGDDFFNDKYYMQIILNEDAPGTAPETEVQQITDYDSATGTFTTNAFTANVDEYDEIMVIHESIVALGRNDADNAFDSSAVVADADGSLLERMEFVQGELTDLKGLAFSGTCDAGMAPSKTTIVCAELAGYGDDFFNNKYFMQIIKNADAPGAAPELERQSITAYVSLTGTFTTPAFTADVEEDDEILIVHESIAAIGINIAAESYDSSAVVANADGSLLARMEFVQDELNELKGLALSGVCDGGMAASKTTIVSTPLAGYNDDLFNDKYYMQIIKNDDTPGAAPETEVQQITGYASGTGTFTTNAFSANVEENDNILILHESLVAVGRNDADNVFDSSAVVADADGSLLERMEFVQGELADLKGLALSGTCDVGMAASKTTIVSAELANYGDDYFNDKYYMQIILNENAPGTAPETEVQQITDYDSATGTFTTNAFSADVEEEDKIMILHESIVAIGRDDADNSMATTNVVVNGDGSILERLEYLQQRKPEWGTPQTGTHTTTGVAEEIMFTTNEAAPFLLYADIDLVNMVAGDTFTFRVYKRIDGTTFRLKSEQILTGAQTIDDFEIDGIYGDAACDIEVRIQRGGAVDRSFPFRWNVKHALS